MSCHLISPVRNRLENTAQTAGHTRRGRCRAGRGPGAGHEPDRDRPAPGWPVTTARSHVIDAVVHLLERSLVQYEATTGRYRLLETLRQYAADRLVEADETLATREAHCAYFCDLLDRFAPHILDARYGEAIARLLPELDNLRAAAAWLAETGRFDELQACSAIERSCCSYSSPRSTGSGRWVRPSSARRHPRTKSASMPSAS